MLTKDEFIEVISVIQKHRELEDNLCSVLESMGDNNYCSCFLYSKYESLAVDLLQKAMNLPDDNDDIEYFIDTEFGLKADKYFITDSDGIEYHLYTADDLYEYLVTKVLVKENKGGNN